MLKFEFGFELISITLKCIDFKFIDFKVLYLDIFYAQENLKIYYLYALITYKFKIEIFSLLK